MNFFKLLGAFVAAVVVTAVLGSISASQFVLAALLKLVHRSPLVNGSCRP